MPRHRSSRASAGRNRARSLAPTTAVAAATAILAGSLAAAVPASAAIGDGVTDVVVIAPIGGVASASGVLAPEALDRALSEGGLLDRQLDHVLGAVVTLAVDPMIAASVEVYRSGLAERDDDDPILAWGERLDGAADAFPLLYGDADPTLLTQSSIADIPATIANGLPVPNEGIVWPRPESITAADFDRFGEAGANAVIVADRDLAEPAAVATTAVASVNGHRVVVTDSAASDVLGAAASATTAQARAEAVAELERAILGDGGRETVVLALDRGSADHAHLRTVLAALDADPAIRLVTLTQLLEGAPAANLPQSAIVESAQPPERLAEFERVVAAERADAGFASILETPSALIEPNRLRTFALAGTAWLGSSEWSAAVDSATQASAALRGSVRIVSFDSLFLADRSTLPISVQNDLVQAVTVTVTARAATGRLDIDETPITITIPPGAQAAAEFPATAVSNGTVAVTATIASPSGHPIGTPASGRVNVQAGWETPVVAGFAVLVLLAFVFGVVRTVRRNRATRRAVEADGDG